ncbi:hypothetical protein E2C01_003400 [Portunus trituberculatus]|uniref:Uncharacterized protein n=1 Tax=Portunus trituberculatus TaxID=210409 RepID=A0A5B7CNS0_PORTR|nr:hypothetical protein [Portunus trituberculatus]
MASRTSEGVMGSMPMQCSSPVPISCREPLYGGKPISLHYIFHQFSANHSSTQSSLRRGRQCGTAPHSRHFIKKQDILTNILSSTQEHRNKPRPAPALPAPPPLTQHTALDTHRHPHIPTMPRCQTESYTLHGMLDTLL